MTKELTLQEKIDKAKPGDVIYHGVKDLSPLTLMEKPTVTREWAHQLIYDMIKPENYESVEFIVKKLKEIGVEVTDD